MCGLSFKLQVAFNATFKKYKTYKNKRVHVLISVNTLSVQKEMNAEKEMNVGEIFAYLEKLRYGSTTKSDAYHRS